MCRSTRSRIALLALLASVFGARFLRAQTALETDLLLVQARENVHQERYAEAERCLREFLNVKPRSAEGEYLLGYVLFRRDQPVESLKIYTAAAALAPPTSDDFKVVGLDYVLLDDYRDAIRWLEKALAENPRNAEAAYHLGRACYTQNWFDRALAAFQQALQIDPGYGKAENNLGLTWAALNRPELAEEAYRKAIRIDSENGSPSEQPYVNLAELLVNHNQLAEALTLLATAKRIQPRAERVEELRGRALLLQNRLSDAETAFRAALELQPDNGAIHYELGRVLKREGHSDEAEREFQRSRSLLGAHSAPPG